MSIASRASKLLNKWYHSVLSQRFNVRHHHRPAHIEALEPRVLLSGDPATSSISGVVWEDLLVDGQRQASDPLLQGCTVELYDDASNLLQSTTSDANGAYQFTDLPAGDYVVGFGSHEGRNRTLYQSGNSQTDSNASPIDGKTQVISLAQAQQVQYIDAGFAPTGRIEIDVWWDFFEDGIQSVSEPYAFGTQIMLSRVDGTRTLSTTLTNTKQANFIDLAPGEYQITITPPTGKILTLQNQGDDESVDSDFDPSNPTLTVTLADGQTISDLGAGMRYIPPITISSLVWDDINANGIQDDDEPGIGSVTLNLLDEQGDIVDTTQTSYDGYYSFTNLDEGTYAVQVVMPNGYQATLAHQGDDTSLDSDLNRQTHTTDYYVMTFAVQLNDLDLGLVELGDIKGYTYQDIDGGGYTNYYEEMINSVIVYLDDNDNGQLDFTDLNDDGVWDEGEGERWVYSYGGMYWFEDMPEGDYIIRQITPDGHGLITPDQSYHVANVSLSADGQQGDQYSYDSDVSGDGRYVTFASHATNLVAGDTNESSDIFLLDRMTNTLSRISVASDGTQANGGSSAPKISSDGRYITFESSASNLVDDDTNDYQDIFLHDTQTGQTTRVSQLPDGTQANRHNYDPYISANGQYIVFLGSGNSFDDRAYFSVSEIYLYDRLTDSLELVDVHQTDEHRNQAIISASVSNDGNKIAFWSYASDIVEGDTTGQADVFVYDRQTQSSIRLSQSTDGTGGNAQSSWPLISADGRFVTFTSSATNLIADQTLPAGGAYRYDLQTNQLQLISVTSDGTASTGMPYDISADGRYVAMSTSSRNMVDGASSAYKNLVILDTQTFERWHVNLSDDADQANDYAYAPAISDDGRIVSFQSPATNLVNSDTNEQMDVFVYKTDFGVHRVTLELGEQLPFHDFTYVEYASITGLAWYDHDANGQQEEGQTLIAGVTVYLLDDQGQIIDTQITNDQGQYLFDQVVHGDYRLQFIAPQGHVFTFKDVGVYGDSDVDRGSGKTNLFTVDPGELRDYDDAGFFEPASISGTVWEDLDADHLQGLNDTQMAQVTVWLLDEDKEQITSTLTDDNGQYHFGELDPGQYYIQFDLPQGYQFVRPHVGEDDTLDSDAHMLTHWSPQLTLTIDQDLTDVDAGMVDMPYIGPRLISGTIDASLLGQDQLPGSVFSKHESSNFLAPSSIPVGDVDGDGFTDFLLNSRGSGFINQQQYQAVLIYGTGQDWPTEVDVTQLNQGELDGTVFYTSNISVGYTTSAGDFNGDGLTDLLFGFPDSVLGSGKLYVVFGSQQRLPDTMTLNDIATGQVDGMMFTRTGDLINRFGSATPAGDINGDGFDDLFISTYNSQLDTVSRYLIYGSSDMVLGEYGLDNILTDFPTADQIIHSGTPDVSYHTISVGDVNADGFDDLLFSDSGYDFTEQYSNEGASYLVYGAAQGFDGQLDLAQVQSGQVAGAVFYGIDTNDGAGSNTAAAGDVNGDGYADLLIAAHTAESDDGDYHAGEVYLIYGGDTLTGEYQLSDLATGQLHGAVFKPDQYADLDRYGQYMASAGDVNGDGLDDFLIATGGDSRLYLIYGHQYGLVGEMPIALFGQSDRHGAILMNQQLNYLAGAGDQNNDGLADFSFSNMTDEVHFVGMDSAYLLYGQGTGITGVAWYDQNEDGLQQDNELLLPDITVRLYDDQDVLVATDLTDNQGAYHFADLIDGQYKVEFVLPQDKLFTDSNVGSDPTVDSDADQSTGQSTLINLQQGDYVTHISAGMYERYEITGNTWEDSNANGLQDDGEVGLANVTVNLLDDQSNVVATTLTDAQGAYAFTDIHATTYSISVELPYGYIYAQQDQGADDTIDSDLNTVTGRSSTFSLTADQIYDVDAGLVFSPTPSLSGVIDLENLVNGYLDGAIFDGIEANGQTGFAASNAGDVNGDGFDDFLVSSHRADSYRGITHLIYGKADGLLGTIDLNGVLDGSVDGAVFNGVRSGALSGISVSAVGDVNGDGLSDLIIGSNYYNSGGESYLIYGQQTGLSGEIDLNDVALGNIAGAVFKGQDNEMSGFRVSEAGDFNGDGIDDLIIGTWEELNSSMSGRTYVVYGKNQQFHGVIDLADIASGQLDGVTFQYDLTTGVYGIGAGVSSAGDVNGDGIGDLIIGITNASPHSNREGQVFLIYGQQSGLSGTVYLSDVISGDVQGAVFNGIDELDFTGSQVSQAGDVNHDGYDDILFYSMYGNEHGAWTGDVYLIYGHAQLLNGVFEATDVTDGVLAGAMFHGESAYSFTGDALDGAGDVNGDGIDDFVIGAYGEDSKGPYTGAVYVIYGSTTDFSGKIDLGQITNGQIDGFKLVGIEEGIRTGISVSFAGDVNGDGLTDLVMGANWADSLGSWTGQSVLVYAQGTVINDIVWEDLSANGVQDQDEPGLADVTVNLLDDQSNLVATIQTDTHGKYTFGNLAAGSYQLEVVLPDDYLFTQQDVGADDTSDSDVDAGTGMSGIIEISPWQVITDVSAGLYQLADISGITYLDINYDDAYDVGDLLLTDTVVYLDANDNRQLDWIDTNANNQWDQGEGEQWTVSDQNGRYTFENLTPGDYIVRQITPDDLTPIQPIGIPVLDLISQTPGGVVGNDSSAAMDISDDGRYVVFTSVAANLVQNDTNGARDVFVYDRITHTIERVNVASDGQQANDLSYDAQISGDGRYVVFSSSATNLVDDDTNGHSDIFVHDRQTGQTKRVSELPDGTQANRGNYRPVISADGRYIAFEGSGSSFSDQAYYSVNEIYLYDQQTGELEYVDVALDDTQRNYGMAFLSLSGDGQRIAFWSTASNLVEDDTNGVADIFVYDRQTQTTRRVSVQSDGSEADHVSHAGVLSDDGNSVVFYSEANGLTGENDCDERDVFVYDMTTGEVQWISQTTDGQPADAGSDTPQISADGRYVVFRSRATNLGENDTNGDHDIFLYDRVTSVVQQISPTDNGGGSNYAGSTYISGDGKVIVFNSPADTYAPNDTNNAFDAFLYYTEVGVHYLSLTSGQTTDDANLAYTAYGSITDQVWLDSNGNGLQDNDEAGLANITVNLLDEQSNVIATMVTDHNGVYDFADVALGQYQLQIVLPAGYTFSQQNVGNDDTVDSDVDQATGLSALFNVHSARSINDIAAGLYELGSISGTLWDDLNADGIRSQDEPLLQNQTVALLDANGQVIDTTVTDANGEYQFADHLFGDYQIQFIPDGPFVPTYALQGVDSSLDSDANQLTGKSAAISLAIGQQVEHVDAGFVMMTVVSSGGGYIINEGESLTLDATATQTYDAQAQYAWDLDEDGQFDDAFGVQPTLTWEQVQAIGLPTDGSTSTIRVQVSDVSGTPVGTGSLQINNVAPVVDPGNAYAVDYGLTVQLNGNATDVSSDSLTYAWDIDGDGIFGETGADALYGDEVGAAPIFNAAGLAANTAHTIKLAVTDDVTTTTEQTTVMVGSASSIGDRIWLDLNADNVQDENEPGMAGVTVKLYSDPFTVMATTTTDADGNYLFNNLVTGEYHVEVVAPEDYGFTPVGTYNYTIEGSGDIIISLDSFDQSSDQSTVAGIAITSSSSQTVFAKSSAISLGIDEQIDTVDVGLYQPVSISGTTWQDLNGDDIHDANDQVLPGITVFIDDDGNGQLDWIDTNANGKWDAGEGEMWAVSSDLGEYSFTNLLPGSYTVMQQTPVNYQLTTNDGQPVLLDITSDQDVTDIDFGYFSPVISDRVWFDDNGNGLQDDGEDGLANITVNLLDDEGNQLQTITTDADGQYLFTALAWGDYIVEFVLPDDYVFTQQNVGADDTIDSDADRVTGRTGVITLADSDVVTSIDAGMMPAFEIVDEHLFHNDSYYDGNGTAVDGDDSQAIDERVQMLQPGQISTSVNYSTSLDGITGIMIDGVDLHLSTISAADFVFKVGNGNDTANWQDAPTPSQVLVLAGEGVGGSDRIAITWEAGSITDQWLEVTIRKAGHVNVLNDEVFYVGNCIGDANGNGTVGIDDVFAVWNNRLSAASSEMATAGSQYDLNKDGAVDISDVFTAWNHRLDQNNMSKYLAPIQPTQQVQQLNIAQPQVAENRLAMAISSMQGRYELNLVAEQDRDPVDLGAFSLTEFLPDSE